jgi:hypothetical protein
LEADSEFAELEVVGPAFETSLCELNGKDSITEEVLARAWNDVVESVCEVHVCPNKVTGAVCEKEAPT